MVCAPVVEFIDVVIGRWQIKQAMRAAITNLMVDTDDVPYDDTGFAMVAAAVISALNGAAENGIIRTIDNRPQFTVTIPRYADATEAQIAQRIMPGHHMARDLAGWRPWRKRDRYAQHSTCRGGLNMDIYSFDNVTMLVDQRPITGYAEGSTVKIEDNEDSILPKVGLDGSVSYAGNSNRSAKVTFTLSQDSASLPYLRRDRPGTQNVSAGRAGRNHRLRFHPAIRKLCDP